MTSPSSPACIDEALALSRGLAQRDPSDLRSARLLAPVLEVKAQTLADSGRRAEVVSATHELLALHERMVKAAGNTPGALRSMTAALRTRGGDFYNLGDIPNACRMWRWAVRNYEVLDGQDALPEFDRKNGWPELTRLIDEVCVRGLRPEV